MISRRALIGGVVAAAAIVVVVRTCKSDEERLSEMVDAGREALDDRRRDDFLALFADPLVYRTRRGRAELEKNVDDFFALGVGRVEILSRRIQVDGEAAAITLRSRISAGMEALAEVDVSLAAEKRDGTWLVTRFDWK